MTRRMKTSDARARFSELLGSVHYTKEPVIVERNGRPFAVVISPEAFEDLEKARRERIERGWTLVDRIRERNADKDPDEVLADITELVEEVRHERYAQRASPRGH